eukprot:symbB.v1.2.027090.t1/scaffold2753.1/size71542/2
MVKVKVKSKAKTATTKGDVTDALPEEPQRPKILMKKLKKKATKKPESQTSSKTGEKAKEAGCDLCEGLIPVTGVLRCRSCGRSVMRMSPSTVPWRPVKLQRSSRP